MSLRRSIARKAYRRDQALDTLEGLGKLPNVKTVTLALAGNTFSGARRRMAQFEKAQKEHALAVKACEKKGIPSELAGPAPRPQQLGATSVMTPAGVTRTTHRKDTKAERQATRSKHARVYPADELDALLFNTLPRAVRKGELSLADYRAGKRV